MINIDITLKKASELTGINTSTIRFYRTKREFQHFFITSGEGRKMKYDEKSTVAILNIIAESYKKSLDADAIVEILEGMYGVNIVPKESSPAVVQQDVIEAIRDVFKEELVELHNKIDTMGERHDKLLMESIRILQERNKKWWRFGR